MSHPVARKPSKKSQEEQVVVTVKMPVSMVRELDDVVERTDSDRSKFARLAIRQRLMTSGGAP
jgi:metal-responsive CopG/Arc/MetJ family transcriptional regulator